MTATNNEYRIVVEYTYEVSDETLREYRRFHELPSDLSTAEVLDHLRDSLREHGSFGVDDQCEQGQYSLDSDARWDALTPEQQAAAKAEKTKQLDVFERRIKTSVVGGHTARLTPADIPADWPVRPLLPEQAASAKVVMLCGDCGLAWDDGIVTGMTPVPAARCPFEPFHESAPVCVECGYEIVENTSHDPDCSFREED